MNEILRMLMPLIGTFIGAWLAFNSNRRIQRLKEEDEKRMSAHRIMFCLLQQCNTLALIQLDYLDNHLEDHNRHINIPAVSDYDLKDDLFDFSSYNFLLETAESREIMYKLHMAQKAYVDALKSLNFRSQLMYKEIQPKLAEIKLINGEMYTEKDLIDVLGLYLLSTAKNSTDNTIFIVKRSYQELIASKDKYIDLIKSRFKTDNFSSFEAPKTKPFIQ